MDCVFSELSVDVDDCDCNLALFMGGHGVVSRSKVYLTPRLAGVTMPW